MLYTSKPGNGIKWEVVFTSCGTQDKGSTQCILVGCMYVPNWNCSFMPLKNSHIYLKENCISLKKIIMDETMPIHNRSKNVHLLQPIQVELSRNSMSLFLRHHSDSKDRFSKLVVKKFKWYCMTYYYLTVLVLFF